RVEQRLLALGTHRWILVTARFSEVTGRVERERIELLKLLRREHAAVFGVRDREVVVFAQDRQRPFNQARSAVLRRLDHGMLVTLRTREEQNLRRLIRGSGKRRDCEYA